MAGRISSAIPMSFFRDGVVTAADGSTKKRNLAKEVLDAKDAGGAPILCGVVYGRVVGTSVKRKQEADGSIRESVLLEGDFLATRALDKAQMKASGFYAPKAFSQYVTTAFSGGATGVDFGIEILAEPNPRDQQGIVYVWQINDLLRQVEISPLDRIRAQLEKHALVAGSGEPAQQSALVSEASLEETKSDVAETEVPADVSSSDAPSQEVPLATPGEEAAHEEAKVKKRSKAA